MTLHQREKTQPIPIMPQETDHPPRFLFWLVVGLFLILVVAALFAFFIYQSQGRLISLVLPALITAIAVAAYTVVLALVFRKSLPRLLALWLAILFLLIGAAATFGGINYYRDSLPPRYQAELITPLPFLRSFLPPTPVGGTLPTIAPPTGGPSALDLLAPASSATPSEAAPATATETPQPTATTASTSTPTRVAVIPTVVSATATPLPPTPTPLPPTPSPTIDPNVTAALALPSTHYNGGFIHTRQSWNNCGPANAAMALSYYGWRGTQEDAADWLKPETEDKNVSPGEIVRFINETTGVRALTRIGGNMLLLKQLVNAGFPVIVEVGGQLYEGWEWIGHYRTVVGYDDVQGHFLVFDSWLGTGENGDGYPVPYTEFDSSWMPFNRVFIVVYEQSREADVINLLGERADVTRANELALEVAQQEARENRFDPFAWFNIGTALTRLDRYEEATRAFDEVTRLGTIPFRMIWYQFYPFEAYYNVGRYDDVMFLVNSSLTSGGVFVEETHYWEGRVFEARNETDAARQSYARALQHNPRFAAAREALDRLGG
ncbi:MAG: C39 family peptidase [Chloroflexota bacterium]|nr:C39 family peptidase [Chloroflexota bacterium]